MNIVQAVILGIVQGLTEFIPVSSTAHLILVQRLMGWRFGANVDFAFNVLIQLGTTVAVVLYFWKDLWSIARAALTGIAQRAPFAVDEARLGWFVVLASLPSFLIGLLFKQYFAVLHEQAVFVAVVLIVASALLFGSEWLGKRARALPALTWLDALAIGFAQAVALIPGVSRSGATISGALFCHIDRPAAARFSFLMSVPVLVGASTLALRDLLAVPDFGALLPPLLAGFVSAMLVGFASIHWLMSYLARRPLNAFGWYRIAAGILFLLVIFLRV